MKYIEVNMRRFLDIHLYKNELRDISTFNGTFDLCKMLTYDWIMENWMRKHSISNNRIFERSEQHSERN